MPTEIKLTSQAGTNAPYKLGSPPDFGTLYSGRALDFDGVTDYVDCGTTFQSTFRGSFSISAWIKPDDGQPDSDANVIFGTRNSTAQDMCYCRVQTNGKLYWIYESDNDGKEAETASAVFVNGAESWHHVVLVANSTTAGAGGMKIYLDGLEQTLDGTNNGNTSGITFSDFTTSNNVYIGANNVNDTAGSFFDGDISNLQIWDKAWSLSDVQYAYTHPEKLITDNSAVTSGTTISNLKAWYPMTEGTGSIVNDGSGNGNHGTNAVGADYITAQSEPLIPQTALMGMSKPILFDGIDDYVSIPETTYDVDGSKIAFNFWVKLNDTTSDNAIFGKVGAEWFKFIKFFNGGIMVETNTSNNTVNIYFTLDNDLHFFSVVTDGAGGVSVYKDGSLVGSGSGLSDNLTLNCIGSNKSSLLLEGYVNELSIFTGLTTFGLSEVQELFNDGVALDATTHSKSGNLQGYWRNDGASKWLDRSISENLVLDGDDDFVNCPNIDLSGGAGTITVWFNHSEAASQTIFAYGSNGDDISISLRGTVNNLGLMDGINNVSNYIYGGSYSLNTWNHLALTVASSGVIYVYINGSAVISDTDPANSLNFSDINNDTLMIGKKGSGGGTFFNGIVDQVAVWDTVLSSDEISSIYNAGRTGGADVRTILSDKTGNLKAYYQFETENLDDDGKVIDLSGNGNLGTLTGGATISGDNNGTVNGSPDTILLPEGTTSGKDILGFPLTHTNNGWLNLSGSEYVEIADNDILDANSEITLEAWVRYFDSPSSDMCE